MGDIRMFSVKKEGGRTITSDIKGFKTDISGTPELPSVSFNPENKNSISFLWYSIKMDVSTVEGLDPKTLSGEIE